METASENKFTIKNLLPQTYVGTVLEQLVFSKIYLRGAHHLLRIKGRYGWRQISALDSNYLINFLNPSWFVPKTIVLIKLFFNQSPANSDSAFILCLQPVTELTICFSKIDKLCSAQYCFF
jgi:hypothetical protein